MVSPEELPPTLRCLVWCRCSYASTCIEARLLPAVSPLPNTAGPRRAMTAGISAIASAVPPPPAEPDRQAWGIAQQDVNKHNKSTRQQKQKQHCSYNEASGMVQKQRVPHSPQQAINLPALPQACKH